MAKCIFFFFFFRKLLDHIGIVRHNSFDSANDSRHIPNQTYQSTESTD